MTIFGVAAVDVAKVKIDLRDGKSVDAPLFDAPRELGAEVRFFIVRLPPLQQESLQQESGNPLRWSSPVRAYHAYDREGKLIERVENI